MVKFLLRSKAIGLLAGSTFAASCSVMGIEPSVQSLDSEGDIRTENSAAGNGGNARNEGSHPAY